MLELQNRDPLSLIPQGTAFSSRSRLLMNERREFAGIAADRFMATDSGQFRAARTGRPPSESVERGTGTHGATERLRDADEKMRCALAACGVGVWEADLTTGVSYWN